MSVLPGAVIQSVLAPAGRQSSSIYDLWSLMLWVSAIVFMVTMAFVAAGLTRGLGRRRSGHAPTLDRSLRRSVEFAVGATVAILFGLLVASV